MSDNFVRDATYDVQICPLSFVTCLTHLFIPPCTDPRTRPRIQESDIQVTCRLKFGITISLLSIQIVKCSAFQAFFTV